MKDLICRQDAGSTLVQDVTVVPDDDPRVGGRIFKGDFVKNVSFRCQAGDGIDHGCGCGVPDGINNVRREVAHSQTTDAASGCGFDGFRAGADGDGEIGGEHAAVRGDIKRREQVGAFEIEYVNGLAGGVISHDAGDFGGAGLGADGILDGGRELGVYAAGRGERFVVGNGMVLDATGQNRGERGDQ